MKTINLLNRGAGTGDLKTGSWKAAAPIHPARVGPSEAISPGAPGHARPQDFAASVRVPVRKANREYLRALRAAELAAWEKAGRRVSRQEAAVPAARIGLVVPGDAPCQRWEAMMYGLLVTGAVLAGLANAGAGLELVARWNLVVDLVRAALT
jgi:hypothetical protein